MNPIDTLLAPIYKYIILALLICVAAYAWSNKSLKDDLSEKDAQCEQKIKDAVQPFKDAEVAAQDQANKASEGYENTKQVETKHTEIINNKVEKIIERIPADNLCFSDDGVSVVNEAATAAGTTDSS